VAPVEAARIAVLSNKNFNETAIYFNQKITGHTFTPIDVSSGPPPTLNSLTTNFDALLLYEDSTFAGSHAVGNVVAAFANTGRPVILGTLYDQDRTDSDVANTPHGWGQLEQIDPNTTDGKGTPYALRTLNTSTMVAHPLTAGLTSLMSLKFAG